MRASAYLRQRPGPKRATRSRAMSLLSHVLVAEGLLMSMTRPTLKGSKGIFGEEFKKLRHRVLY
jgi:hypothetical protein